MDIEKMRSFLTVADTGSFVDASELLYLTASAISKHVAALERELDTQLLTRNTKKVVLTQSGRSCIEDIRQIVESYDLIQQKLNRQKSVHICSVPVYEFTLTVVQGFKNAFPNIPVKMHEMNVPDIQKAVLRGDFELAFSGGLFEDEESFERIDLQREKLGIIATRDSRFAEYDSVSLNELKNEKFVFYLRQSAGYTGFMRVCENYGFIPDVVEEYSSEKGIISAVSHGIGIALITRKMLEFYDRRQLVFIPLKEDVEVRLSLIKKKDRQLTSQAESFWDYADEKFNIDKTN